MYVNITKILSYDIVGEPGFISARMMGTIETFKERNDRLKKQRKQKLTKIL